MAINPQHRPTPEQILETANALDSCSSHNDMGLSVALSQGADRLRECASFIEEMASQARDISQYLAEAKVGACPIPEGVRLLLNRAEQAEAKDMQQLRAEFDAVREELVHACDAIIQLKALVRRIEYSGEAGTCPECGGRPHMSVCALRGAIGGK